MPILLDSSHINPSIFIGEQNGGGLRIYARKMIYNMFRIKFNNFTLFWKSIWLHNIIYLYNLTHKFGFTVYIILREHVTTRLVFFYQKREEKFKTRSTGLLLEKKKKTSIRLKISYLYISWSFLFLLAAFLFFCFVGTLDGYQLFTACLFQHVPLEVVLLKEKFGKTPLKTNLICFVLDIDF